MQNFMKTILSGVKAWTRGEIRNSTADWNQNDPNADSYVKNRTHYDSRHTTFSTCSFDGDLTKKEEFIELGGGYGLVKISNEVPSIDDIIGANYIVKVGDETYPSIVTSDLNVQDVSGGYMVDEIFIVLTEDIVEDGFVATKGIWSQVIIQDNVPMVYVSELNYRITQGQLKKIDKKYLDLSNLATVNEVNKKMDAYDPVGTGAFSMNRKENTDIGYNSHAEGCYATASGFGSHAEGGNTIASGSYSHAEGCITTASGSCSHAEGQETTASGSCSHAEGYKTNTDANGSINPATISSSTTGSAFSHAEGYGSSARGYISHAEGNGTIASGRVSHAEGQKTTASGDYSHAEGGNTTASGSYSHAEGQQTTASGYHSHAEGQQTTASGLCSHAEGNGTTASGESSHAEGKNNIASGNYSHAEGQQTTASGSYSHAEGYSTFASGSYSHAEGRGSYVYLSLTGAANSTTYTLDSSSFSYVKVGLVIEYESKYVKIIAYDKATLTIFTSSTLSSSDLNNARVLLYLGAASGNYSHTEGHETTASGNYSHAEGGSTIASGDYSHAEGKNNIASGDYSHVQGNDNIANTMALTVEGQFNKPENFKFKQKQTNGFTSNFSDSRFPGKRISSFTFDENIGKFIVSGIAESTDTYEGVYSRTYYFHGTLETINGVTYSTGVKYITDRSVSPNYSPLGYKVSYILYEGDSGENVLGKYAHIVGNGTSDTQRSNAHTLDWEGNAWYSGDVYVGSASGTNKDEGSKKLATEEYVDELVAASIENNEQVQSDWDQNDENAVDYIKNKPFYTRYGRVALVDNLTRENYENGIHPVCNFVPGQSYDVVCDDILYENIICIEDDGWNVILGDTFYIDDDGGNGLYIEGFEEDWSTLSIFTTQETVKKIDEKYLPNVRKVLKLYTCYSENADDGRAGGTPALAPDKILRVGFADWEDYVTVEALANADDIVIFEGQTKIGVPANITFCTSFDDYYNTSTEYAIITFYSEHEGKIRTMWSREGSDEYLATQSYVNSEISKISAISLTEDLTDSEKQQVRDNIGAGTSNFSGSYNDLTDKPDLGQQELITPEDIDIICGQSIELASEVLL